MEKIKENDKIKHLNRLSELSKGVIEKVQAMPDLYELKLDLDIILYVCNIIENNIKQNETKSIDKKKIVVDIIQKCTPLNPPEVLILNKMIEFLHSNHLIQKVSKIEKTGSKIFNWALKKISLKWYKIYFRLL